MKKIISTAVSMALVLLVASCQRELLDPAGVKTVTYAVSIPGSIATKAIDGLTLHYEVYCTEGEKVAVTDSDIPLCHKTKAVNLDGTVSLEIDIVNEQNFTVLFWAQAEGNTAFDCETLTNVSVNKDNLMSNSDYEVFSGMDYIIEGVSVKKGDVELTRPVAKLVIATTAAGLLPDAVVLQESSMTVSGMLSTAYNVAKGPVETNQVSTFKYKQANVPVADFNIGSTEYKSVAANCVAFVEEENTTRLDVTYHIVTSKGHFENTVDDVPVRANYRTNIIGNLITDEFISTVTASL